MIWGSDLTWIPVPHVAKTLNKLATFRNKNSSSESPSSLLGVSWWAKTTSPRSSISVSNHVVLWLATKWIYFGKKVLPFDSIRTHHALSIDLKIWIDTASTKVVRENEAHLEASYLDVKSLNAALNSLMKIGLTSRWYTFISMVYLPRNSRVRDRNEQTHSVGRHLYPTSLARQVVLDIFNGKLHSRTIVFVVEVTLMSQNDVSLIKVEPLLHSRCVSKCFALSAHKIDILW